MSRVGSRDRHADGDLKTQLPTTAIAISTLHIKQRNKNMCMQILNMH